MAEDRFITTSDFEALLAWLDPDREQAALKYEEIRSRLIRIFVCRGSPVAEELADETINRVTSKLAGLAGSYSGDPALYFYGVAKNVFRESLKRRPVVPLRPDPSTMDEDSGEYKCLEECMLALPPESRRLVLAYYEESGQAKIERHRELARDLGIEVNALRIRIHRLRLRLQDCVFRCLDRKAGKEK